MEQYVNSFQVELPVPTNSDMELVHYANLSLRRIYRDGIAYKRAGVVVSRIVPEENIQMNLFDEVDRARHRKLMDAVDTINRKMGRGQVKLAAGELSPAGNLITNICLLVIQQTLKISSV